MKKHKQSKMHIENAKNHGVPSSWWFVGGTKPDAFVSGRSRMCRSNEHAMLGVQQNDL
jgi:hypothetical protein